MKLRVRHQIFFLAAIVLVIYYPALSAGVNSVDDSRIVAAYGMGAGKGLAEIFLSSGNYYYRPLVALSYYLDNLLWCMHPRFMHLENILYHLLNTLLLFFIARQLAGAWGVKSPWFPLASALLFAVHPINTESVTWIAGRTDPLAAIFIFSAIWCLLQCLIKGRLQYLYPVLLLFILGVLTKEIAFCFLPVALLLAISWPGEVRIRPTLLRLLAGLSVSVLLLVLVFITFSRTFSVTAFLSSSRGGVLLSVQNALMALGFYLKKLIFPLPLNFAIDAVSSFYILPGVLFVLLLPFCLKMRTLPPLLAVVCGVFLFPSILVSMSHVAWTPYAERYLYLPSAFFCMGFVGAGSLLLGKIQRQQWLPFVVFSLAFGAAIITVQRNFVWQDNLTLYRDTVRKSPDFAAVHLELGAALLQNWQLREGRAEFEIAERLNKRPSLRSLIKENLMRVRLLQGDAQGAREYFYQIFRNKEDAGPEFLRLLIKADAGLAGKRDDTGGRNVIYYDMIGTYDLLYRKTGDPFNLYQKGLLAFRRGDNVNARAYMRKAVNEAPAETHYTAAAVKWLQKLEAGQ